MPDLYKHIIRPVIFRLDAENAHEFAIKSLSLGLASATAQEVAMAQFGEPSFAPVERFGLTFNSPLGIAAGFDKNGVVVNQLAALGFGFVEVGTVTFRPQKGNPRPRLFRLPQDNALINRLGFNNDGAEKIAERLSRLDRKCVIGVNIGKNKDVPNEEAVENYVAAFDLLQPVADYVAVNISSPNTPGLRDLQHGENLEELVCALTERNQADATGRSKPLLIKIAPDLDEPDIERIVDVALRFGVSGIIATNTTISRDGLRTENVSAFGAGGLSGRPLARRSNEVIRSLFRYSKGKLPIVGVGGIFTAEDAFEKIAAGASLVQAYTGFVYGGPAFARDVNRGLLRILKARGFKNVDEAVGSASV